MRIASEPLIANCVHKRPHNHVTNNKKQLNLVLDKLLCPEKKSTTESQNEVKNDPSCWDVILNSVHWHLNIPTVRRNLQSHMFFLKCVAADA